MTQFWFKFSPLPYNTLNLGCGVTAHDYKDAIALLRERVFPKEDMPEISHVIENVDISTLDQNHVIPNMEPWIFRGIWFPKGYPEPVQD